MIRELQTISIQRGGKIITLYDIIMMILNEDKVDSIFCEGSLVIYMFNKICKGYTDDRLIKPGDVDLHVDYHGSWYDFLGSNNHSEIQTRIKTLGDKKDAIQKERRDMSALGILKPV